MAARAKKPGKGAERATRRRKSSENGTGEPHGLNGIDPAQLREYLTELHNISDRAEEDAATARGDIGAVYDRAADKLDVSKEAFKFIFKEERRKRKQEAKAARMDGRARDGLQKLSQALGDTPMGEWAASMAKIAPSSEPETEGAEADAE
jgi:hypothetical protein